GTFHINSDGSFTYTLDNTDSAVNNLNNTQPLTIAIAYTMSAAIASATSTLTITIHGHTELNAIADTGDVTEDSSTNPISGNVLTNDTGGNGTKTVTAVNGSAGSVGTDVPGTH